MRPRSVSSRRRSCKVRSTTTVLATDSATPKTKPAPTDQPSSQASAMPSSGPDHDLHDRAGDRDGAHRQKLVQRELQPDAEHQQDDADFGELVGDVLVGDEARRERADDDAGQQVPDDAVKP